MSISKKHTIIYLSILLLTFGFLLFCLPISGDDWGCYTTAYGNITKAIETAKEMYMTWEGRFIGRILIILLTYYKYIFNIVTVLLMGVLYLGLLKLINIKSKSTYILLIFALIFLNTDMFSQSLTWVAGTVTYFYPTVLVLLYFIYIYLKKDKEYKTLDYIFLILINIIGTMFVENIGCSLVFGNLILCIYYYKNDKKKFKSFVIFTIISSISLGVMLLSPGSRARSGENEWFNSLPIYSKIIHNFGNFNQYLFTRNIILLVLMQLVINKALCIKKVKSWKIILLNIIPLITVITNLRYYTPVDISFLSFKVPTILNFSRGYFIFIWVAFSLLYLYSIYVIMNKDREKMTFYYFLIAMSLISVLTMMILPVWGDRVTLLAVITISVVSALIINEFISVKTYKYLIPLLTIMCINYMFFGYMAHSIDRERQNQIQNQKNSNVIETLYNPVKYVWNNNALTEYFDITYKRYLDLDGSIVIKYKKLTFNEYIKLMK